MAWHRKQMSEDTYITFETICWDTALYLRFCLNLSIVITKVLSVINEEFHLGGLGFKILSLLHYKKHTDMGKKVEHI
jgi:hypothetical protein